MKTSVQEIQEKLPSEKTPEQKEKRLALFQQFDPNNNGYLSLAECDHGCRNVLGLDIPQPVIMRAFQAARDIAQSHGQRLVKEGGDYIERAEFRLFLLYLCRYYDLWQMFAEMDTEGDRRISFDEFQRTIPKLTEWGVQVDDPHAEFNAIDQNGGGQILFNEFVSWGLQRSLSLEAMHE